MNERPGAVRRLDSWKDIATYLGRNVRTAMRWEQGKGLPVHRVPGGHRQAVYAWTREIDQWLNNGQVDLHEKSEDSGDLPEVPRPTDSPIESRPDHVNAAPGQSSLQVRAMRAHEWASVRTIAAVSAVLLILAFGAYAVRTLAFPHAVRLNNVTQITNNGTAKYGMVTDGNYLYFGEEHDGRTLLSRVSVAGGPVQTVPTPFLKAIPADIAPDGKRLLVLTSEGEEDERALWIVFLTGAEPRRVGTINCHSAAWSPDGKMIAFAAGNGIYLTNDEGASVHELQTFSSAPGWLGWSADGMRLRLVLQNARSQTNSFWEVVLSAPDSLQVFSVIPLQLQLERPYCIGCKMNFDERDRAFIDGVGEDKNRIYLLQRVSALRNSSFAVTKTDYEIDQPGDLAVDPHAHKLFVIGASATNASDPSSTPREDLIEYDFSSKSFRPFLPGVAARDVAFSPDGKRITFVKFPSLTLWISKADGSDAQQIDFKADDLELPGWSPDGRWIAFMARVSNRPYRIFVVSALGGKPRETSAGTDSQGAPTWSPDSKQIAYGNVRCMESKTCAIHKIDLSSGHVSTVPGSEGLGTARWSPDGRSIAALSTEQQQVMLFDEATQHWRKLADGVNGNDLSWSSDSRYIFASRPFGNQPSVLRIDVKDGYTGTAVDFSSYVKWTGRIDTWFALTPSGSIIFKRAFSATEIYALSYEDR